jgi:polyhydroxyalkanoate synthase subunit PhaC
MKSIRMTPDQLLNEAKGFQDKLAKGLSTLNTLDEVHYGATDKELVFSIDKVKLYRFKSKTKTTSKTPLLIVYALVNRPYMVDLQADRSIVANLLAEGQEIYLIDWGYPDLSDRYLSMDDYINGYIDACVDAVRARHELDKVNILGICQGGAFSLCYTSLHADKVKNLITMVTPVDFHTDDNMLSSWTREMDVDLFIDTLGNVPADLMNWCYLTLKPFRLMSQKYVGMVDILDNKQELENFLRMEKWIFDSPDQAGECFRQFIRDFYQGNKLIKNQVEIGGQRVDLGNIKMPVLNIFAEQDHLVPPAASKPLKGVVGSKDYTELAFKGGHIGIYVSGRAQREVPPAISQWLKQRDKQ